MDVIILAGGMGTRMGSELPKPLVEIAGKTLINWQLDYLKELGGNIILSIGHKSESIIEYMEKNCDIEKIIYVVEDEPMGTGGAMKLALEKVESEFFLALNCDDLTDIDLGMIKQIKENSIFVANPRLPFGLVKEDSDGNAIFVEKPLLKEKWVSCGWYVLNKEELLKVLPKKGSIEYEVFPKIKLKVQKHTGKWNPFNTKKDIIKFEKEIGKVLK